MRSKSALASTVSVRSWGGSGGWSGRSGLVWSVSPPLVQDAFITLCTLGPVRGPAFLGLDAFPRDYRLPVQCRVTALYVSHFVAQVLQCVMPPFCYARRGSSARSLTGFCPGIFPSCCQSSPRLTLPLVVGILPACASSGFGVGTGFSMSGRGKCCPFFCPDFSRRASPFFCKVLSVLAPVFYRVVGDELFVSEKSLVANFSLRFRSFASTVSVLVLFRGRAWGFLCLVAFLCLPFFLPSFFWGPAWASSSLCSNSGRRTLKITGNDNLFMAGPIPQLNH